MSLLDHALVPVASEEDAIATCDALRPYLDEVEHVTALHVIEKGGGTVDKAPLEKRRADAAAFLATVERQLGESIVLETRTAYGTDLVETVFEQAVEVDATAVAFRPRGGSRIVRFLAGDTAAKLVTEPEVPVVSLPTPTEE